MREERNRAIGVFDSGVGGLTVVRSIRRCLPNEKIIYFGDTARVPYGNKSPEAVKRFSREIMEFLRSKGVKMVVAACNTASSLALPSLKREYPVPIIGVIDPGVREAVRISKNRRIGVIGTNSTIDSRAYDRGIKKIAPSCRLFSKSCPLFVPLVENRFLTDPVTYQIAERYLRDMKKKRIDVLILGCTHYPLLKKVIGDVLNDITLVDSAAAVAKTVKEVLNRKNMAADSRRRRADVKCFVSDDAGRFKKTACIFLREEIRVKKVAL